MLPVSILTPLLMISLANQLLDPALRHQVKVCLADLEDMGRLWQEKLVGLPSDLPEPTWPTFVTEARYMSAAERRRLALILEVDHDLEPAEAIGVIEPFKSQLQSLSQLSSPSPGNRPNPSPAPVDSPDLRDSDSEDDDGRLDLQPEYHTDPFQAAALDEETKNRNEGESSPSPSESEDEDEGGSEGYVSEDHMDVDT